ncbi:MAG: 3-isopropylmalate dehydratase small subunit [Anaerolineae bacterium]|nr:3-isopropylmalate dehydratase small subunit [Anaerolineae bacterium]
MARVWKFGSDVDTDQMVPGRYAPYMRPGEDVGTAAFIEARPDFNQSAQPGDLIVAEDNFGCGSSREYAPLALKRRQVGAIIARSFARIFYRNAINLGIPIFTAPEAVDAFQEGDEVTLDLEKGEVSTSKGIVALPPLPGFAREIIDAGGIAPYVREHGKFPGEG